MNALPVRLHPGDDLRQALQDAAAGCPAFVVSGIGSLQGARLRFAGADAETSLEGPFEILSLAGTLTPDGVHLHMTVADDAGRVRGGHVCPGNLVRTTVEVLLAPLPHGTLGRAFDPSTGYPELVVRAPSSSKDMP